MDFSDVILDPDFVCDFTLIRVIGSFADGRFAAVEQPGVPQQGVVLPAKFDELQTLPEGERQNDTISIRSLIELKKGNGQTEMPDVILYGGLYYRVTQIKFYAQGEYWYAIAQRFQHA